MPTTLRGLLVLTALCAAAAPAAAGPVKHWAQLPGREIRTIALRGDMSREPYLIVVPGADGWIYVRGKNALYRVTGMDGAYTTAASFDWCDDREARAVVRYATPAFACVAKNLIVEMKGGAQYRRTLPTPAWDDPRDAYRYDYPFVTWIDRAPGGRWWFSYGYAGGLGYSDAAGGTRLVRLPGLPPIRDAARVGDDLYVAADRCVLARVRGMRVRGTAQVCTDGLAPRLVSTGEAVWVVNRTTVVERRDAGGGKQRWDVGIGVSDVAYDPASRRTYLLGADTSNHAVLVTIAGDGVPHATRLPMSGASSLAVDRRGRIWISVPRQHALVAIAPPGAWG